ncbi:hypothetical protein [Paenibacillus tyrfis]|uniref:Uncharacterized protein n=1 Tax=Paenibacillus tyrfis TaxID=1501230 RepID=A0A081PAR5_9BACL|nr:hypothetical protein [Paenibacillus tyrfis]KEQ27788.1 hypothetical protein ET33_14050 [Paenibacillus tyrfis]
MKALITVTITKEVELDPQDYGTESPEDMLQMEMQFAGNLLHEWIGVGEPNVLVEGVLKTKE